MLGGKRSEEIRAAQTAEREHHQDQCSECGILMAPILTRETLGYRDGSALKTAKPLNSEILGRSWNEDDLGSKMLSVPDDGFIEPKRH